MPRAQACRSRRLRLPRPAGRALVAKRRKAERGGFRERSESDKPPGSGSRGRSPSVVLGGDPTRPAYRVRGLAKSICF